ncbi:DUF6263 family protein [Saccharicrinis sp. FJH62]|uniref:DUF6263 family protein n=1 Tax=Saccharicrinis sp. FJH62 TaxID=3344657 RepID=UPI0035D44ADE
MKPIYVLILTTLLIAACKPQKLELSLNLEKDKDYKQISVTKVDMTQNFMGQSLDMVMTMKSSMNYKVNDIKDTIYDISAQYDNISMKMESNMFNMTADSESGDDANPLTSLMTGMTNKPFTLQLTKHGEIEGVSGMDKLFETENPVAQAQVEQVKAQLKNTFGEESMKGNLEMSTDIFPDHPVKVGDSWIKHTTQSSTFKVDFTTTYTLVEKTDDYYLIKGISTISTPDSTGYTEMNGMSMQTNMKGTMSSAIKIDKNTGWPIESKLDQDLTGLSKVKGNSMMPDGMEISMKIKSSTIVTDK